MNFLQFVQLIIYLLTQKWQKESTTLSFRCAFRYHKIDISQKTTKSCAGINKARTRILALFGIFIIHLLTRFVNIHFVRFFVVIFGKKYMMKKIQRFVVVLFVYFATTERVVVGARGGIFQGKYTNLRCRIRCGLAAQAIRPSPPTPPKPQPI